VVDKYNLKKHTSIANRKSKNEKNNAENHKDSKPKIASPTEIQTSMQEATPKKQSPIQTKTRPAKSYISYRKSNRHGGEQKRKRN